MPSGEELNSPIGENATLNELRESLSSLITSNVEKLVFMNMDISNMSGQLREYGINDMSIILVYVNDEEIRFHVMVNGKTDIVTMSVLGSASIIQMLSLFNKKNPRAGGNDEDSYFTCNGKTMNPQGSLMTQGVKNGTMIQLCHRVRGGCPASTHC